MRATLRAAFLRAATSTARLAAGLVGRLQSHLLPRMNEKEREALLLAASRAVPAEALSYLWHTPGFLSLFRQLERRGAHLTPRHFYFPVPDTGALAARPRWASETQAPGFDLDEAGQLRRLAEEFPRFRREYEAFAPGPAPDPAQPPHAFHLHNGSFDGIDAMGLHCFVRQLAPARVIEVGSGYSTRVTAAALLRNGKGELTCIEPYPDPLLRSGFPGLTRLIESRVQDVDRRLFEALDADDILFIDSSHVVAADSDVAFLVLEVLPRLRPGVVVHLHDIFLPFDYPRWWVCDRLLFWTEQYLLQAFLSGNRDFEVLLASAWLRASHPDALRAAFPTAPPEAAGQSFWIRRRR